MSDDKYPIAGKVSMKASNALYAADLTSFDQLTEFTHQQLLKIENFGRRSLREVVDVMNELGLRLMDGWGCESQNGPSIGIELVYHTKPDVNIMPALEADKDTGAMRCKISMPMPVVRVTIKRPDGSVSIFEDGGLVVGSEQ